MSHKKFVQYLEAIHEVSGIPLSDYHVIVDEKWDLYTFFEWLRSTSRNSLVEWMACSMPILRLALFDGVDVNLKNASDWTALTIASRKYLNLVTRATSQFELFFLDLPEKDLRNVDVARVTDSICWPELKTAAKILKTLRKHGAKVLKYPNPMPGVYN